MSTKMVIVVRKDLKMKPGKLAAQVGHAVGQLVGSGQSFAHEFQGSQRSELFTEWDEHDGGAKVVLACLCEQQLLEIYNKAIQRGLPASIICDAGRTVFKEPTNTCVGIGPWDEEEIDKITGKLKLL